MRAKRDTKRKAWRTQKTGNVAVAIYRREKFHKPTGKRYQVFEVADYSTGVRRLLSFSDPEEATQEAERIGLLIANGETTGASMKNREAASYGRAVELLRGLDVPLELAAAHFAEAFKILGGDRIVEAAKEFTRRNPTERPARTIAEVTAEFLELQTKRQKSACYVDDLRTRLTVFGRTFANVRVDSITGPDLQGYLDKLDAAPRTVKNVRNNVNALFKFAESKGYIGRGENPVAETLTIKAGNDGEQITIYSPEEITRLLNAAPDWFKPILAIQAFAGVRSAEVRRLDWQDVKLDRGHIELEAKKTKTKARRLVPITPNLAKWLEPHAKSKGKIFAQTSRAYFHEVQADVAAKTAVEADKGKGTAAQNPVAWKKNALRHSFISYRVADIQDVPKVALEAGNSPAMIFANYRELVTPQDAKAWFAIVPPTAPAPGKAAE